MWWYCFSMPCLYDICLEQPWDSILCCDLETGQSYTGEVLLNVMDTKRADALHSRVIFSTIFLFWFASQVNNEEVSQ